MYNKCSKRRAHSCAAQHVRPSRIIIIRMRRSGRNTCAWYFQNTCVCVFYTPRASAAVCRNQRAHILIYQMSKEHICEYVWCCLTTYMYNKIYVEQQRAIYTPYRIRLWTVWICGEEDDARARVIKHLQKQGINLISNIIYRDYAFFFSCRACCIINLVLCIGIIIRLKI